MEGSHRAMTGSRRGDPPCEWDHRSLVEDALARSMDDWLHVADFTSIVSRSGLATAEGLRAAAIGLITQVLVDGLMAAGDVDEFGFHAWPESGSPAIDRIVQLWDPSDPYPAPGSVAWLARTERGTSVGQAVLDREAR
jgi:hypothetical protein